MCSPGDNCHRHILVVRPRHLCLPWTYTSNEGGSDILCQNAPVLRCGIRGRPKRLPRKRANPGFQSSGSHCHDTRQKTNVKRSSRHRNALNRMTVGRAFRCRQWWFRLALFRGRSSLVYSWFLILILEAVLEGNVGGFDDLVCVMIAVVDSSGR